MPASPLIDETVARTRPPDAAAMAEARARQSTLTKPPGSLGRLEDLSVSLAGIFGDPIPRIRRKTVIVAAAGHGVVVEGVSDYPQDVTPAVVLNFPSGGAAINVLTRQAGKNIVVLDAGVAAEPEPSPALLSVKAGRGTANMAAGPAMSLEQAVGCVETGVITGEVEIDRGTDLMACGNTTASGAVTAAITGADPGVTTGRGTDLEDHELGHEIEVVRRALRVNRPDPQDGLDVLAKVGGFEIGVLAGVMPATAANRRPVLVDGFISGAAALVAWTLASALGDYLIASHRSVEPGHQVALDAMGLSPLLAMEMRLGEGTGAAPAMHVVEAAAKCLDDMATFAQAGVSGRVDPEDSEAP